ncbi:MAG: hypothetical protein ACOC2N_02855 [Spirochaetota bacterium]
MYDQCSHSVPDRIVRVSQPHVRPIVRGKASAPVEFGAKTSVSKIGRFAFLDRLSWDAYQRADTSESAIAIAFLVMNLETLLQILLRRFAKLRQTALSVYKSLLVQLRTDSALAG